MTTEQYYDLIFMDLQMPDLNGYQTSLQIRQLYKSPNSSESDSPKLFCQPYIVVITAGVIDKDMIESCKQVGIDDQFTAPLSAQDIKKNILPKLAN